jgi:hypothetical protein
MLQGIEALQFGFKTARRNPEVHEQQLRIWSKRRSEDEKNLNDTLLRLKGELSHREKEP